MSQLTPDAKHAIALAMEGIGGLAALTRWARTHQMTFYTQLYSKLIPHTIMGSVDVNVNDESEAKQKLQDAFERLVASRTIEHDPLLAQPSIDASVKRPPAADVLEPAPAPLAETSASPPPLPASSAAPPVTPIIDFAAAARRRAMEPSIRPQATNTAAAEQNSTALFYDYYNSGSDRMRLKDWGPI